MVMIYHFEQIDNIDMMEGEQNHEYEYNCG
jgi:hypothetical protein